MHHDLPTFEEMFGDDFSRLRGIDGWAGLAALGRANLARLEELADALVFGLVARGEPDLGDLVRLGRGKRELTRLRQGALDTKPRLPRLRHGLFRAGDRLRLYMGDTPGATGESWRHVEVVAAHGAYHAPWARDSSARGHYWRVVVRDPRRDLLPGHPTLAFSTTEPRAILDFEFDHLLHARHDDPVFFKVFCDNARRTWTPIWCLELGLECPTASMDPRWWFEQGAALAHAS